MSNSNSNNRNLQFEEYKLFRDTAIHFDKILLDIRKITISLAFIIFGLVAEVFRINNLPSELDSIDLAIALILIEFSMVLIFFYLEVHYREYLLKIANIAGQYEVKLDLGKGLENCDRSCTDKKVGISKCLKCIHDNEMDIFIRIAHRNIYTSLLTLGLFAFFMLMGLKMELEFHEILPYSLAVGLIAFVSFIIYALRNIKQQIEEDKFKDNFSVYLFSIIIFVLLTYCLYYLKFDICIVNDEFLSSFIIAFFISIIFFFIYGFFRIKFNKVLWNILLFMKISSKEYFELKFPPQKK